MRSMQRPSDPGNAASYALHRIPLGDAKSIRANSRAFAVQIRFSKQTAVLSLSNGGKFGTR